MKCQASVNKGASRVKSWKKYVPCMRNAKYKVTYNDYKGEEVTEYFCGCHLNSFSLKSCNLEYNIEKL